MFAAPGIQSSFQTTFPDLIMGTVDQISGAGNAISHSLTSVAANTTLVLLTGISLGGGTDCSVSSSPALTWNKKGDSPDTSAEIHVAYFAAGGNITITP